MTDNQDDPGQDVTPPPFLDRRSGQPGTIPPEVFVQAIANAEDIKTEAEMLRAEIRKASAAAEAEVKAVERQVKSQRKLWVIAAVTLLVLVVGQGTLTVLNRITLIRSTENVAETRALADSIEDCLNPKGECAKESQKQTDALVGEPQGPLNTVTVASAACGAKHPGDFAATARCVRALLATLPSPVVAK